MDHLVRVHIRPDPTDATTVVLDYRGPGTRFRTTASRTAWIALINAADAFYYVSDLGVAESDPEERYRTYGRHLFDFLDGGDGTLTRLLAVPATTVPGATDPGSIVLAVSSAWPTARQIPWEIVHDGHDHPAATGRLVPIRLIGGDDRDESPVSRRLSVLFMACAPAEAREDLDYDAEEAAIEQAAAAFRPEPTLEYECTGSLAGLRRRLSRDGSRAFDVFHLSGHAVDRGHRTVFVTEDAAGRLHDASGPDLTAVLRISPPRLTFLSGCHTAQPRRSGAAPSLAEEVCGDEVRTVLGWARRVRDDTATEAAARFYAALLRGASPASALGETRRQLRDTGHTQWHCLRMFTYGRPIGPLAAPATDSADRLVVHHAPPTAPWGLARIVRGQFVGRRQETKLLFRDLDPAEESAAVGVVVHGLGGTGKTTLVSRVLEMIQDRVAFVPVNSAFDRGALLTAMRRHPHLADLLGTVNPADDLERLLLRVLTRVGPIVFVLDQFERNIPEDHEDAAPEPAAATTLAAVLGAVAGSGRPHRVVVTSRYPPLVAGVDRLNGVALVPLSDVQVRRKIDRLRLLLDAQLGSATIAAILRWSGSNTRLVDTLFRVAADHGTLLPDQLDARLRAERDAFCAADLLLDNLLDRQHPGDAELLRRIAPLRIGCDTETLARLMRAPTAPAVDDVTEAERRAAVECGERLAGWHLLESEHDARRGLLFRLPAVLEPQIRAEDPVADGNRCAQALAATLGSFDEVLDPRLIDVVAVEEVFRLAMRSRDTVLVLRSAYVLAWAADFNRRFDEMADVVQEAMTLTRDPSLVAALGESFAERGEEAGARTLFAEARRRIGETLPRYQARTMVQVGFWETFVDPAAGVATSGAALDLARASRDVIGEASSLRQRAIGLALLGAYAEADQRFREAVALTERIAGGEQLAKLVVMDRAGVISCPTGEAETALADLLELREWYARRDQPVHLAATELRIGECLVLLGRLVDARREVDRARRATRNGFLARFQVEALAQLAAVDAQLAVATIPRNQKRMRLAEESAGNARKAAEAIGWPAIRRIALDAGHGVYLMLGEFEKARAVRTALDALDAENAEPAGRKVDRMVFAAENLQEQSRPDDASELARGALRLVATDPYASGEARARRVLVTLEDQATMPVDELRQHLTRLAELYQEVDTAQVPLIDLWLGQMWLREDRSDAAGEVLARSLAGYRELNQPEQVAQVSEVIANVASAGRARREAALVEAVRLRLGLDQLGEAIGDLKVLADLRDGDDGTRTLEAALAVTEASGNPSYLVTILDALAAAATGAESVDFKARADECRRRGEPLHLVVGVPLSNFLDPDQGGLYLAELKEARTRMQREESIELPSVAAFDDNTIDDWAYVIYLWGEQAGTGTIVPPAGDARLPVARDVVDRILSVARGAGERLTNPPLNERRELTPGENALIESVLSPHGTR